MGITAPDESVGIDGVASGFGGWRGCGLCCVEAESVTAAVANIGVSEVTWGVEFGYAVEFVALDVEFVTTGYFPR